MANSSSFQPVSGKLKPSRPVKTGLLALEGKEYQVRIARNSQTSATDGNQPLQAVFRALSVVAGSPRAPEVKSQGGHLAHRLSAMLQGE
ncbi:hypothetical protein WH50_12840 [Pokkaliibacter plantistimulans]|uniref:Uncharacterized protein n=1 Tax=Pokkaliibacter plantistimulans TaxID=1635171 RepID=A0ABX5M008_9GAMM|nr:hypothetical protein [Pokkaliibacter plantistimulans]PXF30891.1 hypothetical protein WH50_12840 [Pokkaliibacter plantistimulans]